MSICLLHTGKRHWLKQPKTSCRWIRINGGIHSLVLRHLVSPRWSRRLTGMPSRSQTPYHFSILPVESDAQRVMMPLQGITSRRLPAIAHTYPLSNEPWIPHQSPPELEQERSRSIMHHPHQRVSLLLIRLHQFHPSLRIIPLPHRPRRINDPHHRIIMSPISGGDSRQLRRNNLRVMPVEHQRFCHLPRKKQIIFNRSRSEELI